MCTSYGLLLMQWTLSLVKLWLNN